MTGGGRPLLPEILDQSNRVGAKSPIFDFFARSDSAVTPSETRNSSGDEIANVNVLYHDIVHVLQNTIGLVHKFRHRSTR